MRYYELALKGYYLENLIYQSQEKLEPLSEVKVSLRAKKNKKQEPSLFKSQATKDKALKELSAIVLKECQKPEFNTENIVSKTGFFITEEQFDLAFFISSYYLSHLGFILSFFECIKPYTCKALKELNSPSLNQKQNEALAFIKKQKSSLLFADTGAGKTEIYIALIKEYLEKGEQVLLLMPEISLSPQMQKRLEAYFKGHFFMWHSKISKAKKQKALEALANGEILLVAGARSALFLPFANLKCIIVDEEHDNSYKANSNPRYNARDLALFLGAKRGIKVLLGSATPSLTSFAKQPYFRLKGTFFESKKEFIYDESELALSGVVLRELRQTLKLKKQAIVFLPTRANFRQILCKNCGKTIQCPFCSVPLSLHLQQKALKCHYCSFTKAIDKTCPSCGGLMLEAQKMGTAELCERLNEALKELSPSIQKFDSDEITSMTKLNAILKDFNERKIDILIGTSMLAKGHDYHSVNLSVILGLDEYLFRANYKAKEESLALAMQVAGRAGRKGFAKVLIQTKQRAFFEEYIQNYDAFLQDELEIRKDLYPPFKRLLRLIIEDKNQKKASMLCEKLALEYKKITKLELVGYGACALEFINAKFRFYLLLRSKDYAVLMKAATYAFSFKEVIVDMDPIDFS